MKTAEPNQQSRTTARVTTVLEWPQKVSYGWLAACLLVIAIAIVGIINVARGIQSGDGVVVVGSAAFTIMMGLASVGMVRNAGFRWIKLSPRVSARQTAGGAGIAIPTGRLVPLLVSCLACVALGGLTASIAWHLGIGETLLPASRDNSAGANFMGICGAVGLVFAVFFLLFRSPSVLQLTPSGVAYHRRCRRGFRVINVDEFAAWADIASIRPETHVVHTGQSEIHNPLVRVTYRESDSPSADAAAEQDFLIRAFMLTVEPNTLHSLMKRMNEHPEDRDLLAGEDAAQLLTPPPLRERFRAAREAKKVEKETKRAARSGMRSSA